MSSVQEATVEAFNGYLESQRQAGDIVATLTLFDFTGTVSVDTVFEDLPGDQVPLLTMGTYQPRGGTPLLDAVGRTLASARQAVEGKDYDSHIFVVLTDGFENSSKEWSVDQVREQIKAIEQDGWQVIFLGANQDAWDTAHSFGSTMSTSVTYGGTGQSVAAALTAASFASSLYRSSGVAVSSNVNVVDPATTDEALAIIQAAADAATPSNNTTTVELEGKASGKSGVN
jgi:hypothetical protein